MGDQFESRGNDSSDEHSCSICFESFQKTEDLQLHSQLHDKNNDFKCFLCGEIFTDLEEFKVHDLRHSLEEAEEDVADIEQMILPFGLKSCELCGEKFSCDEELINHFMNHRDVNAESLPETHLSPKKEPETSDDDSSEDLHVDMLDHSEKLPVNMPPDSNELPVDLYSDSGELPVDSPPDSEELPVDLPLDSEELPVDMPHDLKDKPYKAVRKRLSRKNIPVITIDDDDEELQNQTAPKKVKKSIKPKLNVHLSRKKSNKQVTKFKPNISSKNRNIRPFSKSKRNIQSVRKSREIIKKILQGYNVNMNPKVHLERLKFKERFANMLSEKDILFLKAQDERKLKEETDDDDVKIIDDVEEVDTTKGRRSKQLALKKRLWKQKTYLPPPTKLKDCPSCNKSFGRLDDYKKHILTHEPKSEFYKHTTSHTVTNKKHIQVESDDESESDYYINLNEIVCLICYHKFSRKKGLQNHLVNVHKLGRDGVNYYMDKVEQNSACFYKCPTCKKKFYRKSRLASHDCMPAISVVCEICHYKLSTKIGLKKHLMVYHELNEEKVNSLLEQLADYNSKFYKKLNPTEEVTITGSDGRSVSRSKDSKYKFYTGPRCEKCGKGIASENYEMTHVCAPRIKIICEHCKYAAPSKFNLTRHLLCIHKLTLKDVKTLLDEFAWYSEKLKLRVSSDVVED